MNVVQPVDLPQPVKLTVEQFAMLDRSGAFDRHARTELIEGAIYAMQGQFRRHSFAKNELTYRLRRALEEIGSELLPQSEATVELLPYSAPEPDIVVTRAPRGEGYVPLESVALVVEVSDTSGSFDRGEKAALYARHGIPEYWIVDMPAATVRQLWRPTAGGYQEQRAVAFGERVESVTIAGLRVESDGLI